MSLLSIRRNRANGSSPRTSTIIAPARPASSSARATPRPRTFELGIRNWNVESLLSKLAVHETGVERAAYDADAVTTLHQITVEANPCDEILQHLQSVAPVISAHRVPERRSGHEGRAACARLFVLGPIRGDALRPTRTSAF